MSKPTECPASMCPLMAPNGSPWTGEKAAQCPQRAAGLGGCGWWQGFGGKGCDGATAASEQLAQAQHGQWVLQIGPVRGNAALRATSRTFDCPKAFVCQWQAEGRTKVSLSHARPIAHAARIGDILQVEPLLHKECAAIGLRHCPSLVRDVADGSLRVRQVTRYAVQMAIMSEEFVESIGGLRRKAIGHGKVQLLAWQDRDAAWLSAGSP